MSKTKLKTNKSLDPIEALNAMKSGHCIREEFDGQIIDSVFKMVNDSVYVCKNALTDHLKDKRQWELCKSFKLTERYVICEDPKPELNDPIDKSTAYSILNRNQDIRIISGPFNLIIKGSQITEKNQFIVDIIFKLIDQFDFMIKRYETVDS